MHSTLPSPIFIVEKDYRKKLAAMSQVDDAHTHHSSQVNATSHFGDINDSMPNENSSLLSAEGGSRGELHEVPRESLHDNGRNLIPILSSSVGHVSKKKGVFFTSLKKHSKKHSDDASCDEGEDEDDDDDENDDFDDLETAMRKVKKIAKRIKKGGLSKKERRLL